MYKNHKLITSKLFAESKSDIFLTTAYCYLVEMIINDNCKTL